MSPGAYKKREETITYRTLQNNGEKERGHLIRKRLWKIQTQQQWKFLVPVQKMLPVHQ